MQKHLLLLALALLCAVGTATATQQQFIFGVWGGVPYKGSTMEQQCAMLHDTLRMNTVFDDCLNDYQLEQYSNPAHPLKVIVSNQWYSGAGMNSYLRLYTLAPYAFFESEGTEFAASHLRYIGGSDTTIGLDKCHYFQALANPPDSLMLIQTGPGTQGSKLYNQLGWYWPQFIDTTEERAHLQYQAFLRFKLGPRTGPVSSEPIAAFYISRHGGVDEVDPGGNDSLITQTTVFLYDSQFDSAGTDFIWSNVLEYQWNNSFVDSLMTVKDVMFNVRWSGSRDIYIDKVKVMDKYGERLWEDTVRSYAHIDSFVTKFYKDSPTVLGWYLQDDQDIFTNYNNVFSARRVDSLLTNRFSKKPGFLVPGAWVDEYLAISAYSNVSYQSYPIKDWIRTSSEPPIETSIQVAWDNDHIPNLSSSAALAMNKGVPHYATIQSYSNPCLSARLPALEENLCMVNLALAYGVKGILYWKYGPTPYYCPESGDWCPGFDSVGASSRRSEIWYQVKDVIGPYIDKMGPLFASLKWKGAWKWGETPGSSDPLHGIFCNQSGGSNLYLQVAHFHNEGEDAEYFMLVNRRCLPSETISGQVYLDARPCAGGHGTPQQKPWYVTDMEEDSVWPCHLPFHDTTCVQPQYFNYDIAPGAAKLYRVTPSQPVDPCTWHHGDANSDGSIDIADAVFLITYIFKSGPAPNPAAAGDANCDSAVDIADAVFLITYIFKGGAAPCPGCD